MIKKLDITNSDIATQVLKVQIPSYMEEAKLINFYEIPPLKDSVETLKQCGEIFYGYFIDAVLCGAISYKVDRQVLDIHRLIVDPNHFRKGIAHDLLQYVEDHETGVHTVTVSTGTKNYPAMKFYEKHGFNQTGEMQITEGLSITSFEKSILE